MNDLITIKGLQVETRVGVPPEERARPQSVTLDVEIEPSTPFDSCPGSRRRSLSCGTTSICPRPRSLSRLAWPAARSSHTLIADYANSSRSLETMSAPVTYRQEAGHDRTK